MTELFILFLIISTGVAFTDWRKGLFLVILAGALQDPVRKMMPGAPAIMVLGFLPIWLAVCVNFFSRNRFSWQRLKMTHKKLAKWIQIFLLSLLPATAMIFQYGFGAWKMAAIGLFGYIAPVLALILGFSYVIQMKQLERLLKYYCVVTSVFMIGSIIEYLHLLQDWSAIGTAVFNMQWIRYVPDANAIDLIAGFYRSPDVMGWHASTLVMLGLTLMMSSQGAGRWRWLMVTLFGGLCLLISGRNKMILMPAVWLVAVSSVYILRGKSGRIIKLVLASGILVIGILIVSGEMGVEKDYFTYTAYGASNIGDRLENHAWYDIKATYDQSGFFGKGIGVAAQGVQHADAPVERSWQEGGADRLLVELGVLGLLFAVVVAVSFAQSLLWILRQVDFSAPSFTALVGLTGFVAANACSFIISHQAYSDALILTLTAFLAGVILSGHLWSSGVRRENVSREAPLQYRNLPRNFGNSRPWSKNKLPRLR